MPQETLIRKLNQEVKVLRRDVLEIKNIILAATGDTEGEYQAEFIKKILERAKEKPRYTFQDRNSFLRHVYAREKHA